MQYPGSTVQEKYLWNLTLTGMMEYHDYEPPKERIDRVKLEMDVIVGNGFTDYILMIWDIINFCNTPDRVFEFCEMKGLQPPPDGIIPTGPGRGSVGGSLVCFYIGIHKCDPIKFGLYFERFLNPERIAPPDYMIVEPCGNMWC